MTVVNYLNEPADVTLEMSSKSKSRLMARTFTGVVQAKGKMPMTFGPLEAVYMFTVLYSVVQGRCYVRDVRGVTNLKFQRPTTFDNMLVNRNSSHIGVLKMPGND